MKLQPIADSLILWCRQNAIKAEKVLFNRKPPSGGAKRALSKLHPDLPLLYEDSNGIVIAWDKSREESGLLKTHEASELIEMAESESRNISEWSDADILGSGYDRNWWKTHIPIYRSLVKFYDEGNGDFMAVSHIDGGAYFVFHDWMDWVCTKEPPTIKAAKSVEDLVTEWATIQFACPKHLYWLSAVKDGHFTGFNDIGFLTSKGKK